MMEKKVFIIACVLGVLALMVRLLLKKSRHPGVRKILQEAKEWSDVVFQALLLAFLLMTFVIQAFKIPSGSMKNTLLIKDHLFVLKFIYGTRIPFTDTIICPLKAPERGEVIVFRYPLEPSKDFIKRVIGVGGDKIEIKNKKVYLNGELLHEPYVIHTDPYIYRSPPRDNFGPLIVPEGHYFVMGDNRDESADSRFWGVLSRKYIKGKALFVYWPLYRIKIIK